MWKVLWDKYFGPGSPKCDWEDPEEENLRYLKHGNNYFEYNEKSLKRSLQLRPLSIEQEADMMKYETEKISMDNYESIWEFSGYYPKFCKETPEIHIN